MRRLAIVAALAALPMQAWASDVSWGTYRQVLATCVRHVQCESDACLAATKCDPSKLTWADRNWIDGNPEAIHDLAATPAEIAKSRVAAQVDGEIATETHGVRLDVEKYVFGGPSQGRQAGLPDTGVPTAGPMDQAPFEPGDADFGGSVPHGSVEPLLPPRGQPSAWGGTNDGQAYGSVAIEPSPASIGIRPHPRYDYPGRHARKDPPEAHRQGARRRDERGRCQDRAAGKA